MPRCRAAPEFWRGRCARRAHARRMQKATMCAPFAPAHRARMQPRQTRHLRRPLRAVPSAASPCAVGELIKLLVAQAEQRALQHGRQREIVVRQQQRIAEHQQVHDGDVFGQHQPVGAGDRDPRLLERADHRLEHAAALAHQNEHARARPRAALRDPAFSPCGAILARQLDRRAGLAGGVERRVPALPCSVVLVGLVRSQISTSPGDRVR